MALIASYATLQSEALAFMDRAGQAAQVSAAPTWVQMAEARLNRELGALETDTTLTGTLDSRTISISSLSIVEPVALFLAETDRDEVEIDQQADGSFPYLDVSGKPAKWAIDGTNIDFDRPLDSAYPFRFRYRQKLALATTDPNWLLTEHPDVYLAATLMWGAGYNEDWPNGQVWKMGLDEGLESVRKVLQQRRRGMLRVDEAIISGQSYSLANWTNDG